MELPSHLKRFIHRIGYLAAFTSGLAIGATASYLYLGSPEKPALLILVGAPAEVGDVAREVRRRHVAQHASPDAGAAASIDAAVEAPPAASTDTLDGLFHGDAYCPESIVRETLARSGITDLRRQHEKVFAEAQGYYWAGRHPHEETAGNEEAPLRAYCLYRLFEGLEPVDSRRAVASYNAAQALLRFADKDTLSADVRRRYACGAVEALGEFARLMERDQHGAFRPNIEWNTILERRFAEYDSLLDDALPGGELYEAAKSMCESSPAERNTEG